MPKHPTERSIVAQELIEAKIYIIRGRRVMLDRDLAALYAVETKALNQAVKRNTDRFPNDFMFQLTKEETHRWGSYVTNPKSGVLRSQFVTLKRGRHTKYPPFAFTENGVAMLSSVLNSKKAIQVNIQIMRTFTRLREMLASNEMLRQKIEDLERKFKKHDQQFQIVFEAIKKLLEPPPAPPKRPIGFY